MKRIFWLCWVFVGLLRAQSWDVQSPIGLVNLGSTCYQNAAIQVLFALPEVREFCYKITQPHANIRYPQNSVGSEFVTLITRMTQSSQSGQPLAPETFCSRAWAQFNLPQREMNDAGEFYIKLLGSLINDLMFVNDNLTSNPKFRVGYPWNTIIDSILSKTFYTYMYYERMCLGCRHEEHRRNYLQFSSFEIDESTIIEYQKKLQEKFISRIIEDYYCETCSISSKEKIQAREFRGPRNAPLIISLFNRYAVRDPKPLAFLQEFDFKFTQPRGYEKGIDTKLEHYQLVGIIGAIPQFHYVAFAKYGAQWYLCNDTVITAISAADMEKFAKEGHYGEFFPRMLIFRKTLEKPETTALETTPDELTNYLQFNGINRSMLDAYFKLWETKKLAETKRMAPTSIDSLVKGLNQQLISAQAIADNIKRDVGSNLDVDLKVLFEDLNSLSWTIGR